MLVTERTFAGLCERIEKADSATIDYETSGLCPWLGDYVAGEAVKIDGEDPAYFPFRHEGGGNLPAGSDEKLNAALRGKRLKGWNLRFDLMQKRYATGGSWALDPAPHRDAIVDAVLLDENQESYTLEAAAERTIGAGYGESKRKMEARLGDLFPKLRSASARKAMLHKLPANEVAEYACGDVVLPDMIDTLQQAELRRQGLESMSAQLQAYNLLLARMQYDGVPIDVHRCRALSEGTAGRQAAMLAAIRAEAGPAFNPGSWQQVTRLLGTADAKQKTLGRLGTDLARRIVGYKKLGKAKAAYYDKILELVDARGILHPQLNLTRDQDDEGGARTGRLSCSDPNFQALPHADDDPDAIYQVRDLIVPPPGYKIAKLDYERAEMWMAGSYVDEPLIIAAYHEGRDLYAEIAAARGITRQEAKGLWLMLQYGAGPGKLSEMFGWPARRVPLGNGRFRWVGQAADIKNGFFNQLPLLGQALWAYSDAWKARGILRTWAGRPLHYSGERSYAAWNRVIQGGVSDMIRVAMVRLEPVLAALGARMILQVHDELVVLYPEERESQALTICREVMTDFPNFKLRPRVDVKTSAVNYARCA